MKRQIPIGMVLAAMLLAAGFASCTKPLASARVKPEVDYVSRTYAAVPNDIYYAARWALVEAGYSVGSENLADGVLTTAWQPVRSSSHYIPLFNRKDFGVTNSYHQLEIRILPGDGRAEVQVGSRMKTLVSSLKSAGTEERRILDDIGSYLRKGEPTVTNLGVDE